MAAINGVELSNEAQAALHEMISRMSAAHIAQLAGKIPGGFREPKAIRSYLLQQCKARSELNPLVKGLLRGSWRPLQLVATLSAEALALCLSSLQGAFRQPESAANDECRCLFVPNRSDPSSEELPRLR
jgi:hypothetical protein